MLGLVGKLLRAGGMAAGAVAVLASSCVAALSVHVNRLDDGFAGHNRGMVCEGTIWLGAVKVEAADGARWFRASVGRTVGGLRCLAVLSHLGICHALLLCVISLAAI